MIQPILVLLLIAVPIQSPDVSLEGIVLQRFLKTRGASLVGQDVHWKISAKVFSNPDRSRGGYDLYTHKGIGLVIGSRAADLLEIRRRGGVASVRGRVFPFEGKGRKPDDPRFAIDIREIRRRRK
jgi:hypothetical protein